MGTLSAEHFTVRNSVENSGADTTEFAILAAEAFHTEGKKLGESAIILMKLSDYEYVAVTESKE